MVKEKILVEKEWEDTVLSGTSRDNGYSFFFDIESHKRKELFRTGVSWHIPTKSLIELAKSFSPLVSVGSGYAYTESLIVMNGGDVIATDISPDVKNRWCTGGIYNLSVEKLSAVRAIKKYSARNVFMAWPPYDNPMAYNVVKNMKLGKVLIFVGESEGGCTGDENFFRYLRENFEEVEVEASIPSWIGIHDNVYVYKKNKE